MQNFFCILPRLWVWPTLVWCYWFFFATNALADWHEFLRTYQNLLDANPIVFRPPNAPPQAILSKSISQHILASWFVWGHFQQKFFPTKSFFLFDDLEKFSKTIYVLPFFNFVSSFSSLKCSLPLPNFPTSLLLVYSIAPAQPSRFGLQTSSPKRLGRSAQNF